jgi:hypothetical protein
MSKISNVFLAGLLSAALFAVPAMAQKEGGGVSVGGGKAASGGGSGGGKAMSGGGGGGNRAVSGGNRSGGSGGSKAQSNPGRSSGGAVRSSPRNSGVVIQQNRNVVRDRNAGGNRHVGGNRGGHRGVRHLWGGLPFYFYDGYYHGDCGWLRRRAEATGSRYWWVRYRQCREDD